MKKFELMLVFFYLMCIAVNAQDDYNDYQKNVRDNYMNFLTEEGFMPKVDEDGHIEFKKEGRTFWVIIGDDIKTYYIQLQENGYSIGEDDDLSKCLYACNEINRQYKVGKVYISSTKKSIVFKTQIFIKNIEEFKYVFYRLVDGLTGMYDDFQEEYNNAPSAENVSGNINTTLASKMPFLITNTEIANVYQDGTIETNYGANIYDFNTMYLKPKITITPFKTGTFTVYIKVYTPSGDLSTGTNSSDGFSTKTDITINSLESLSFNLTGWGGENKGTWSMGNYRFEFWIGDVCVGSKTFKVY